MTCLEGFPGVTRYGPTITGNGTSAATCTGSGFDFYYWDFHLIS